jgi:DNA polymerase/3'-5' exonuclease PolX
MLPRDYITTFKYVLKIIITKYLSSDFKMDIAGSYRRGMQESSDIDLLITSTKFDLPKLIDVLQRHNIVTDVLSMKNEKFMGIAHCPANNELYFRFDIEFIDNSEYASALLYFTGSQNFNIMMRQEAKKQGFTLNQHGLFNNKGVLIPTNTEKQIFRELGMEYVVPERR